MQPRCSNACPRSSGAGPPTTGAWSPARRSTRWITTCGSSPTSGPSTVTRTSQSAGSRLGTSACSTPPGATDGYSVTATAAATYQSSPGRGSSDTRWSRAARPRTTPPSPTTGPNGEQRRHPQRSAEPAGASMRHKTVAARSAGTGSCPPRTRHKPHASGSSGKSPPARRSFTSPRGRTARQTNPNPVSYTPTATASAPATAATGHFCPHATPPGLLEPDARKPARPVLRGAERSNALGLPDRITPSMPRTTVVRSATDGHWPCSWA